MEIEDKITETIKQSLEKFQIHIDKTIAGINIKIKEEIENLIATRLTIIEKKLEDIENSHQFHSEQYEAFCAQVGNVLLINTELKEENTKLAKRIRDLESKDQKWAKDIDDLEQYGRREMLGIGGIPRLKDENCKDLVMKIAGKLRIEINSNDVEACHRISERRYPDHHQIQIKKVKRASVVERGQVIKQEIENL